MEGREEQRGGRREEEEEDRQEKAGKYRSKKIKNGGRGREGKGEKREGGRV